MAVMHAFLHYLCQQLSFHIHGLLHRLSHGCNIPEVFNAPAALSLHLRLGSAAPCPTLSSCVTSLTLRTQYGRLAIPYPTGFPCCVTISLQRLLAQSVKNSLRCFPALTHNFIISYPVKFLKLICMLYYHAIKFDSLAVKAVRIS